MRVEVGERVGPVAGGVEVIGAGREISLFASGLRRPLHHQLAVGIRSPAHREPRLARRRDVFGELCRKRVAGKVGPEASPDAGKRHQQAGARNQQTIDVKIAHTPPPGLCLIGSSSKIVFNPCLHLAC
jgi:hypothetical protein